MSAREAVAKEKKKAIPSDNTTTTNSTRCGSPAQEQFPVSRAIRSVPPLLAQILLCAVSFIRPVVCQVPRLVTELTISGSNLELDAISNLAVAQDGRIVAWQRSTNTLLFFSPEGELLHSFGRKGEGPAEFRSLGNGGWLGDTLWVIDPLLRRTTFIAPGGALVRVVKWPNDLKLPGSRESLLIRPVGHAPATYLPNGNFLLLGAIRLPGSGLDADLANLPIVDHNGIVRSAGPVVPLPGADSSCVSRWAAGAQSGAFQDPFCAYSIRGVSASGKTVSAYRIIAQKGATSELEYTMQDLDGRLILKSRHLTPLIKVPRSVRDSVLSLRDPARPGATVPPQEAVAAFKRLRVSPFYPPVDGMLVGHDSTAWISSVRDPSGEIKWTMVDASGRKRSEVTFPKGSRVMAVSRARMWTVEEDSDGVPSIKRFRLVNP